MAIIRDTTGANALDVNAAGAALVTLSPVRITVANGGRYRIGMRSGLITTIAAHTATAGHLFVFRWGSATKTALVDKIRLQLATVTDFTTLQQFAVGCRMARSYTASHAGGTAATLTGDNCKLRSTYATTGTTDARMATTAELTAGTHVIDTQPILVLSTSAPSAGATTDQVPWANEFNGASCGGPIVLAQDQGFVVSNETLMGAAGTAILAVELEWREYLNADVIAAI